MGEAAFDLMTNNYSLGNTSDEDLMNPTDSQDIFFHEQDIEPTMINRTTTNSSISAFYPIIIAEMVLSVICLILGIVVYSILPEFKNVHGKNLISLSSCLLVTYSLLCLDIALRLHISYYFCFTIAVIIHAMFLATFFWTNVMAFDIYNNVTSMKPKCEVKRTSTKYMKYSIYAWSATILATLPAVVFESTDLLPPDSRPNFGLKRCWLSGKKPFIYYFNLPVGIILFVNLIMFALTVRKLYLIKKMTAILHVKKHQQRLNLYLKLFLVMGIIWFTEFLPWVTNYYPLYALAGILTALHGVFLFIIFVLKKRVFRQIKEKLGGKAVKKNSTSQQTLSTGQSSTTQKYVDSQA